MNKLTDVTGVNGDSTMKIAIDARVEPGRSGGVFARQVEALGRPGDVLLAISTSGTSVNVIRAISGARAASLRTIVLTGHTDRLAAMADVVISVPSAETQHIQEAHLAIEHPICYLVEREMFAEAAKTRAEGHR